MDLQRSDGHKAYVSWSVYAFVISAAVAFLIHIGLILTSPICSTSSLSVPAFRQIDLQDDGSKYYGKPLITIGAIPFDVNTQGILNQFEVSIASWLRCTAQVVVHLYDVVGGMGKLAPILVENLQREFGAERVFIKEKIIKKDRIETIPEAFEAVERNTETVFSGWFSNDMILPTNWMDYVYLAMKYFHGYDNFSMHFARRDLFESCRKDISLADVVKQDWPEFFDKFKERCRSRLHTLGYDCYLWNHKGINMTKAQILPFFIGRPNFDGAIMKKQMDQGWFITAYPELLTYHLEHPDRLQYTKRPKHPDSIHNAELHKQAGGFAWRNEELDLRLTKNGIFERKNGEWFRYSLDRPDDWFPLTHPL